MSTLLLAAVCLGGFALRAEQGRLIVSVLAPLAYGPNCWSNVRLQNLGTTAASVQVEGHKGSGALVALVGAASVSVTVAPAGQLTLRLQVPGEESLEGWVKVSETVPVSAPGPAIAVSGETECVASDKLTTVPQTVAFPTRDPWLTLGLTLGLTSGVSEVGDRVAMLLNVANQTATARACYSSGIAVSGYPPNSKIGGELKPVCTEVLMQIPPFGIRMIPVAREGNSRFSIEAKGESLVLRVLLPQRDGIKTYTVDSSVKFGQPLDPSR